MMCICSGLWFISFGMENFVSMEVSLGVTEGISYRTSTHVIVLYSVAPMEAV